MATMRLGKTELIVERTAFGVLPIQRVDFDTARDILQKAFEQGVNFYDTARAYSDSEEKIGYALSDVRDEILLATKTGQSDREGALGDLETSLRNLKTDYVDLWQLHNPGEMVDPADPEGAYAAMLEAKKAGKVRFLGITAHRLSVAMDAAASGLFDTVQFPLSAISSEEDLALIAHCEANDVGVIAMKALCGGLLTYAPSAFAFLRQYENVLPIWGIQRMTELDELLSLESNPPTLDEEMLARIEEDRKALTGSFCRACGYCQPCPQEIPISMAARMDLILGRMPPQQFLTKDWQEKMALIEHCTECGACSERCPYELDPPMLLKRSLKKYQTVLAAQAE